MKNINQSEIQIYQCKCALIPDKSYKSNQYETQQSESETTKCSPMTCTSEIIISQKPSTKNQVPDNYKSIQIIYATESL